MTDPDAYRADPNHLPHPGRPPAEKDSQGPSDMPDAQRPSEHQEPDADDTAHEQTTTMRTREPASTHGPPHEERPVVGPSERDVRALNEPVPGVGERSTDPSPESTDPDPRQRGDVGDERGPGAR